MYLVCFKNEMIWRESMKRIASICLLAFVYSNSFCMDNIKLRFVESTCPTEIERFRAFGIGIDQALIRTENLVGEKRLFEDVLRFFLKNRDSVVGDSHLLNSICKYITCKGKISAKEPAKVAKLKDLVVFMLTKMSGSVDAPVAFQSFYRLFSADYIWILAEQDKKFAVYAVLAHANVAENLSKYDVNTMNSLRLSYPELDDNVKSLIVEIEKSAHLVGSCDMRGINDYLVLSQDLKTRISAELKRLLDEENPLPGSIHAQFKDIVVNLCNK
jgi:hypothetical protein